MCARYCRKVDVNSPGIIDTEWQYEVNQRRPLRQMLPEQQANYLIIIKKRNHEKAQKHRSRQWYRFAANALVRDRHDGFRHGEFQRQRIRSAHPAYGRMQQVYSVFIKVADIMGGVALPPVVRGIDGRAEVQESQCQQEKNRAKKTGFVMHIFSLLGTLYALCP